MNNDNFNHIKNEKELVALLESINVKYTEILKNIHSMKDLLISVTEDQEIKAQDADKVNNFIRKIEEIIRDIKISMRQNSLLQENQKGKTFKANLSSAKKLFTQFKKFNEKVVDLHGKINKFIENIE